MSKIKRMFKKKRFLLMLTLFVVCLLLLPSYKEGGAEVSFIFKNSPFAEQLQEGDLINSINGAQITTIDDYKAAILKLKPDDADMHYGRGLTYYYLGNYYYAVKDWEKAIELDPKLKAELEPRIKEAKEKLK